MGWASCQELCDFDSGGTENDTDEEPRSADCQNMYSTSSRGFELPADGVVFCLSCLFFAFERLGCFVKALIHLSFSAGNALVNVGHILFESINPSFKSRVWA